MEVEIAGGRKGREGRYSVEQVEVAGEAREVAIQP